MRFFDLTMMGYPKNKSAQSFRLNPLFKLQLITWLVSIASINRIDAIHLATVCSQSANIVKLVLLGICEISEFFAGNYSENVQKSPNFGAGPNFLNPLYFGRNIVSNLPALRNLRSNGTNRNNVQSWCANSRII